MKFVISVSIVYLNKYNLHHIKTYGGVCNAEAVKMSFNMINKLMKYCS